jgi:hypothetical protein
MVDKKFHVFHRACCAPATDPGHGEKEAIQNGKTFHPECSVQLDMSEGKC